MYQGVTPQTPQQQMQGPGFTPQVQPMGGMLDAAVQAGFGVVEQYAELKDFGASQQAEHQRRLNDQQMREEFESKMQLPWGAEGGFYDSEGNRKDDEVSAFVNRWQEENNKIPRPFWLAKNAMRDEADLMQANDALASRVGLMTLDAEFKNRQQAFQDNYDLAVEQEDWAGVNRTIDRAVEAGQITRMRGEVMRLKMSRTLARKAAARARDGVLTARKMTDQFLESLKDKDIPAQQEQAGGFDVNGNSMGLSLVDEFNRPSVETGTELFELPEDIKEGLSSLSPDQFEEEWTLTNMAANQATSRKEPNTGKFLYSAPSAAPEAVQAHCYQASVNGGFTKDNVKRMIYAVAAHLESHPDYAGLPDGELRKAIIGRVTIKGLEDDLFSDAEFPDVAAQAFTEGIVDNVLVARKSEVDKRVNDAFRNWEEMGPTHADIAARFKDDDAYRNAVDTFFLGWNDAAGLLNAREYPRYKKQFLTEKGLEETEVPDIEAFRNWFFEKGSIHDQRVKSFVESVKDFYKAKATDAVAEYRKKGGKSWAEEQQIIQDVLKTPLDSVIPNVKGDWREKRQEMLKRQAESYRQEAKRWLPALKVAQEKGAAREKAREEQAEDAQDRADEPKKWQQEREKALRKKEWTEAQERADAAKYPYKYKVNALVGFRNDGEEEPVMTVPAQEYARMLSELEAGDDEGIVVKVGNGRNEYAVRPGNVEGMNMNAAMIRAVYGTRRLSKSQLKKLINGHKTILKFNKF